MRRLFLFTAILGVLGLTSCEKEPSKAIVGTWKATKAEVVIGSSTTSIDFTGNDAGLTYSFDEDGTGSLIQIKDGETNTMDFDYRVEENILKIGGTDLYMEYPIISIDRTDMTLKMSGEDLDIPGVDVTVHFVKQ